MSVSANIVEKAKNGDSNAWSEMYSATYPVAFGVAMQLIKNKDTVEDILQDSYITAYTKLDTLQETDKFQHWFNRIVANNCKNYLVKKKPELFSQKAKVNDEGEIIEFDIEDERDDFKPDSKVFTDEINALFYEMLEKLPKEQQTCVLMCWVQELTIAEVAEILGISENTVKSRLHYAKKKLTLEAEEMKKKGITVFAAGGFALIPFMRWLFSKGSGVVDKDNAAAIIKLCKAGQGVTKKGVLQTIFGNGVTPKKILPIISSVLVVAIAISLVVPRINDKPAEDSTTTQGSSYSESTLLEVMGTAEDVSTTLETSATTSTTTNTTTDTTTAITTTTEKVYIKNVAVTRHGTSVKRMYFQLDNMIAFCANRSATPPPTGTIYNEVDNPADYSACNKLFIAASLLNRTDEEFYEVIQIMVWVELENNWAEDAPAILIGSISDTALNTYEQILATMDSVNENDYKVTYLSFETDEKTGTDTPYQTLIHAVVTKK